MDERIQYYVNYVNKLHEGNQNELHFIDNQLKKHLLTNQEDQTEIEHILDFLYSTQKVYKNIGYKTILEKTKARDKKLQTLASKDDEVEGVDYEVVHDFNDGYKFVKLLSQSSYNREGQLMSHCVSSYYGRNVSIYSLRDSNNNPHCTIEENNQVKGKGNQTVDNKYFAYCIKFLEIMGFSIGENEMQNIGYYKLDSIDEGLSIDSQYLYDGKYISDKHLDKIKDKNGEQYYGFGLWKIKSIFEFNIDMKVKFNFDFEKIRSYFTSTIKNIKDGSYNEVAMTDNNEVAMTDNNEVAMTYYNEVAMTDNNEVAMTDNNEVAMTDNNKVAMTDNNKVAMTDNNKVAMTYYNEVAMRYNNKVAMTDNNEVAMRYNNEVAMTYYNKVAMTDNNEVAMTDNNEVAMTDNNKVAMIDNNNAVGTKENIISSGNNCAILMGNGSKVKGKKGTIIVLYHRDSYGNIIDYNTELVDGKKIKENVFYKLEGGKFKEVE